MNIGLFETLTILVILILWSLTTIQRTKDRTKNIQQLKEDLRELRGELKKMERNKKE